jgi:tetratricopeptide (TPR) repeat protein
MHKSTKAGLLAATVAILLSNVTAGAATTDTNGVNLYLHGQYETAMPYLERAAAAGGNAQIHYYLADTYYRLGRTADALSEYNIAYKMDPKGPVSGYCQQMIRTLQTYNPGRPNVKDPSQSKPENTQARKPGKIVLPAIPEAPALTKYDEVRRWDYLQRVRFAAQADEQVKKAQIHLKMTQDLLKESNKIAGKELIPTKRAWGETQNEWRSRVQQGGVKEGSLVAPYEKAVAEAKVVLSDAKAVQAACKRSTTGDEGPVPTTLVPYNGDEYSSGTSPFTAGSP